MSSLLIDKYNDDIAALRHQLAAIDDQLTQLNTQRDDILQRISFNESNVLNIVQHDTPSLGYLSNELIKILLSYMHEPQQLALYDINKHYRSYKMMTFYYKLGKNKSFDYYLNKNGMRDRIESSVANPNQQISLTFSSKAVPDVSVFANVHSLTLRNCTLVKDVSSLRRLSYIDITGSKGIKDISALVNVDTLIIGNNHKKLDTIPLNLNVKTLKMTKICNLRNLWLLGNCTSVTIDDCSLFDSNISGLSNVNTVELSNVKCETALHIEGWRNQTLTLSSIGSLKSMHNLRNIAQLHVSHCSSLNKLEDIDGIEDLQIYGCLCLLKISDMHNIDKMTLLYISTLTTIRNIYNVKSIEISFCRALRDISALSLPEANVEVLTLRNLDIVAVDVRGRIPEVILESCNSVINVAGLSTCRTVTIRNCGGVRDVTALGHVQQLTLMFHGSHVFTGLQTLGQVKELHIEGVNMASTDLRCYADVQKLTIRNCSNVNISIDTLRLLQADRDSKDLIVVGCAFDSQTSAAIKGLKASNELSDADEDFYSRKNSLSLDVTIAL